jgi:putative protease
MHAAFDFGADAVYAGQPRYSLRARNNEFSTLEVLQQGLMRACTWQIVFCCQQYFPA